MATTYDDFNAFAQAVQILHATNPGWVRLNGKDGGGDQNAWGYFKHAGRTWKVDADSHILPILIAHEYSQEIGADPFLIDTTPTRDKLVVAPEVQQLLVQRHPTYQGQHLYIYSPRES